METKTTKKQPKVPTPVKDKRGYWDFLKTPNYISPTGDEEEYANKRSGFWGLVISLGGILILLALQHCS